MLQTRLTTGFSIVGVLVLLLWLDEVLGLAPWYPFWFLAAVVAMGASALEFVGMLGATSARPSGNAVFGGVLAMLVANWAPHLTAHLARPGHIAESVLYDPASPVQALAWPFWCLTAIVMFAFIAQSVQFVQPGRTMATIAGTILAVAYVGLLGTFLVQIRWLPHAVVPLAALIATAKGSDVGAYTLGRLAGRHKLWPRLSPNKTVEGAVGGLIFGVAAAVLVEAGARVWYGSPALGWGPAVGFGVVVGAAAQLGDLMESMIKRDCARKDASDAVPGFGGVLDVLDSLLFAGPVAFGYWLIYGH